MKPSFVMIGGGLLFVLGSTLNTAGLLRTPMISVTGLMTWQFPLSMGYWVASLGKESWTDLKIHPLVGVVGIVLCGAILRYFNHYPIQTICVLLPVMVVSVRSALLGVGKFGRFFEVAGKLSMSIWLTHTFYCYYYWGKLVYAPRNSLVVLLVLLTWCYLASLGLEALRGRLFRALGWTS